MTLAGKGSTAKVEGDVAQRGAEPAQTLASFDIVSALADISQRDASTLASKVPASVATANVKAGVAQPGAEPVQTLASSAIVSALADVSQQDVSTLASKVSASVSTANVKGNVAQPEAEPAQTLAFSAIVSALAGVSQQDVSTLASKVSASVSTANVKGDVVQPGAEPAQTLASSDIASTAAAVFGQMASVSPIANDANPSAKLASVALPQGVLPSSDQKERSLATNPIDVTLARSNDPPTTSAALDWTASDSSPVLSERKRDSRPVDATATPDSNSGAATLLVTPFTLPQVATQKAATKTGAVSEQGTFLPKVAASASLAATVDAAPTASDIGRPVPTSALVKPVSTQPDASTMPMVIGAMSFETHLALDVRSSIVPAPLSAAPSSPIPTAEAVTLAQVSELAFPAEGAIVAGARGPVAASGLEIAAPNSAHPDHQTTKQAFSDTSTPTPASRSVASLKTEDGRATVASSGVRVVQASASSPDGLRDRSEDRRQAGPALTPGSSPATSEDQARPVVVVTGTAAPIIPASNGQSNLQTMIADVGDATVQLARAPASADQQINSSGRVPAAARTMVLQLSPSGLGTITLRMHVSGSSLDLRLEVSEKETASMLNGSKSVLATALADQHYQLHSLEITSSSDASAQGPTYASQERNSDPAEARRQEGGASNGFSDQGRDSGGERAYRDQGTRADHRSPTTAEDDGLERHGSLFV